MTSSKPGFDDDDDFEEMILDGERPEIPDECPEFFRTMITKCWHQNPEERPEFVQILKELIDHEDPLFADVDMADYNKYKERVIKDTNALEPD